SGQYNVGVPGGLREEEIDHTKKLELFESLAYEVTVGQRDDRVEADREQSFDFTAVNRLHDFHRRVTGLRNLVRRDAPNLRDVPARFWIGDLSLARQLIAFLSMFASALAVSLAGDHDATGAFSADVSGCETEIDQSQNVLDTFGMMFNPAGMHRE